MPGLHQRDLRQTRTRFPIGPPGSPSWPGPPIWADWLVGQYVAFSGYEGVRQANCHFAGEHCSQDFQGFMEGGASEGVRAAGEILADLK